MSWHLFITSLLKLHFTKARGEYHVLTLSPTVATVGPLNWSKVARGILPPIAQEVRGGGPAQNSVGQNSKAAMWVWGITANQAPWALVPLFLSVSLLIREVLEETLCSQELLRPAWVCGGHTAVSSQGSHHPSPSCLDISQPCAWGLFVFKTVPEICSRSCSIFCQIHHCIKPYVLCLKSEEP